MEGKEEEKGRDGRMGEWDGRKEGRVGRLGAWERLKGKDKAEGRGGTKGKGAGLVGTWINFPAPPNPNTYAIDKSNLLDQRSKKKFAIKRVNRTSTKTNQANTR